jgi:hypothetical protein
MAPEAVELITQLGTQLGMAGIFLFLLLNLWKDYKQMEKDKDIQIQAERDKKDEDLKNMTEILIATVKDVGNVLRENAVVQEGVRAAITGITSAVENNTEVLRRVETEQKVE